jgi:alpha,alpha-trehalase
MRFLQRPITRLLAAFVGACFAGQVAAQDARPPSELYGPLFVDVQMSRVFPDSKTFVDAVPKQDPGGIVAQ